MLDLESGFGRGKVCNGVACFVEMGESTCRFGRSTTTARSKTEPTSLTTVLAAVTLGRKRPADHDRLLDPHPVDDANAGDRPRAKAHRTGRVAWPRFCSTVDLPGRVPVNLQSSNGGQKADGARPRNAMTSLLATAGGAHQSTRSLLGARSSLPEFMLVRVGHWSMPRLPMPQNRRVRGRVRLSSPVDPSSSVACRDRYPGRCPPRQGRDVHTQYRRKTEDSSAMLQNQGS